MSKHNPEPSAPRVLRGALLMHLDAPRLERGEIRVAGGAIDRVAPRIEPEAGDVVEDLGGHVILPGLVVGHHHLYSALAPSMPPPPRAPRNFHEVLQLIWWRLDRALDLETTRLSGLVGALDALRCGVTTIIDHHASPSCIDGSLDALAEGVAATGLRAVLCYEVTNRNGGAAEQQAGLRENERFIRANGGPRLAGMVGAHAAFTIDDDGLRALAALAESTGAPIHIHVAEDPCDDAACRQRYKTSLMLRLEESGVLREGTLVAHGTHLTATDVKRALRAGCRFAHNPRSNMNNGVGHAPVEHFAGAAVLGTDGIGGDLLEELRAACFKSSDRHAGVGPDAFVGMMARSAQVAGERLGVTLGKLEPGAQADLAVLEAPPSVVPGLSGVSQALVYAMSTRLVRHVMVGGEWALRDGNALLAGAAEARARVAEAAPALWARLPEWHEPHEEG